MGESERRLGSPFSLGESDNCISPGLGVQASHVSGFDYVLDVLRDGKYHTFKDIMSRQIRLNENQLEAILAFFEDYAFIRRLRKSWSTRTRKVMLTPAMLTFLNRLKELEACK